MGRVHGDSSSNFIVGSVTMFCLLVASFTFAFAYGAPAAEADAEADPQFLGGAYHGVPVGPAPNCVTERRSLSPKSAHQERRMSAPRKPFLPRRSSTRRCARMWSTPSV